MSNIVNLVYENTFINFTDDGWFNATVAAERFEKRPVDWLALESTKDYIAALADIIRSEKSSLLKVKRGGRGKSDSTWMHPKLAVNFARWLDVRFAIWCDVQIDGLVRGSQPNKDWTRLRHEAASSFKVMSAVLQEQRKTLEKETASHHYSNEARLVNWALKGEFKGLDRELMSIGELDLLAKLEERNAVLIAFGKQYNERKKELSEFSTIWQSEHQQLLPDKKAA